MVAKSLFEKEHKSLDGVLVVYTEYFLPMVIFLANLSMLFVGRHLLSCQAYRGIKLQCLIFQENDVYSIKLQKYLSDLESLLKTLTHGKGASNDVNSEYQTTKAIILGITSFKDILLLCDISH